MKVVYPHVSLVVATYGRHDELDRLLKSLTVQSYADFEVIVVDQNKPSFLADIHARYEDRLHLRWLFCEPHGVSGARNIGIAAVCSDVDILGFPDDDCWYEPDTIASVVSAFARHPECAALLGQWRGASSCFIIGEECFVTCYSVFRDSMTYNFFLARQHEHWPLFDEKLGPGTGLPYGCGEDTDYLIALLAKGGKIIRCPSVHVRHPDIVNEVAKEKIKSYAIGRQYLLDKWNYPTWFKLANIVYPLLKVVRNPSTFIYRMRMFFARVRARFVIR